MYVAQRYAEFGLNGKCVRFMEFFKIIDERKKAEINNAQLRKWLGFATESSQYGIWGIQCPSKTKLEVERTHVTPTIWSKARRNSRVILNPGKLLSHQKD